MGTIMPQDAHQVNCHNDHDFRADRRLGRGRDGAAFALHRRKKEALARHLIGLSSTLAAGFGALRAGSRVLAVTPTGVFGALTPRYFPLEPRETAQPTVVRTPCDAASLDVDAGVAA